MNQIINYPWRVHDPLENIKFRAAARLLLLASESVPQAPIRWEIPDNKMLPFAPLVLEMANAGDIDGHLAPWASWWQKQHPFHLAGIEQELMVLRFPTKAALLYLHAP